MEQFNASSEWGTKKQISALKDPISEFNARGGLDLNDYRFLEEHLATEHPNLGEKQWAEIQKQLPAFELIEDPESGQKLRIQRFNWPEDGDISEQTVTFSNMPFSVPINPEHIQYEHYLIAKELGTPFVVFENPAYGDSDKLTKNQKEALKRSGDFGPIADTMLGIATTLGTRKANLIGYSMGAETASAMAANASKHNIEVENLFVMEGPGVQAHKPLKLAHDFMSDANNLKFTWANPVDPVMREISNLKPSLPRGTLSYGRAMIKRTQEDSLRQAIDTQPNMHLTIASAGASKISPLKANNDLFSRLHSDYPERFIRRIIIPGEGHAYGDSGQRFASLCRIVLGVPSDIKADNEFSANQLYEREIKKKSLVKRALGSLALKRLEKIDEKHAIAQANRDFIIRHGGGLVESRTQFKTREITAKRRFNELNSSDQEKLRRDLQKEVNLGNISMHDMLVSMRNSPLLINSPERDRLNEAVSLDYISTREKDEILSGLTGENSMSNTGYETKSQKRTRVRLSKLSKKLDKARKTV